MTTALLDKLATRLVKASEERESLRLRVHDLETRNEELLARIAEFERRDAETFIIYE